MARDIAELETIVQRTLSLVQTRIPILQAYVFGSHVEGTAREDSDIDIAAFSRAVDNMTFEERAKLSTQVERQINAPIELHLFGAQDLAEARPSNFFGYLCAWQAYRIAYRGSGSSAKPILRSPSSAVGLPPSQNAWGVL